MSDDDFFGSSDIASDDATELVFRAQLSHIDEADRQRRSYAAEMQKLRDQEAALRTGEAAEKFLCLTCRSVFLAVQAGRRPPCSRCRSPHTTPTMLHYTSSLGANTPSVAADVLQKPDVSEAQAHGINRPRTSIEAPTITEE